MNDTFKRLFDIIASSIALLVLLPFLVLIALSIRLDSFGPSLFTQVRIGRNRQTFRILKFRTMVHRNVDAIDQYSEQIVQSAHDPRITRIGRLLRATSFDELPQLWNILVGDMSFVGPRPILPEQEEVVPSLYGKRFDVRPGLTGLAQIRGRRSLDWLNQLRADAEYVDRRSALVDLRIIFQTIPVLLSRNGVYDKNAQNWRTYRSIGRRTSRH